MVSSFSLKNQQFDSIDRETNSQQFYQKLFFALNREVSQTMKRMTFSISFLVFVVFVLRTKRRLERLSVGLCFKMTRVRVPYFAFILLYSESWRQLHCINPIHKPVFLQAAKLGAQFFYNFTTQGEMPLLRDIPFKMKEVSKVR